jgi:hypothetical protein
LDLARNESIEDAKMTINQIKINLSILLLMISSGAQAQAFKIFLPLILNQGDPFEDETKVKLGDCAGLSLEEVAIMKLIANHAGQRRSVLTCNKILYDFAKRKGQDMALRSYFSHTDPDGYGPNYWVRLLGYPLPSFYSSALDGNNIESLAGGYATPEIAFAGWLSSAGHRTHVLGEISFYQEQGEFGLAYIRDDNSVFKNYWVFISARRQ